jgi:cytochrome c553
VARKAVSNLCRPGAIESDIETCTLRHKPGCGMFCSAPAAGRVTGPPTLEQWRRNMINNHVPPVFGILAVLAALAAPANAAESAGHIPEIPAVATPGNAAEAKVILGAKLLVCNTCHGDNGVPKNAAVPVIWGMQEGYLLKQLHDFQSGDRSNEVMTWMATSLTPAELGFAAAYFAKKNWPTPPAGAASTSPPGVAAAVCEVCHQQKFAGGVAAPRLAGQKYEYLVEAMRRFAEGERTNNPDMRRLMEAISPADREAIARYISGL